MKYRVIRREREYEHVPHVWIRSVVSNHRLLERAQARVVELNRRNTDPQRIAYAIQQQRPKKGPWWDLK